MTYLQHRLQGFWGWPAILQQVHTTAAPPPWSAGDGWMECRLCLGPLQVSHTCLCPAYAPGEAATDPPTTCFVCAGWWQSRTAPQLRCTLMHCSWALSQRPWFLRCCLDQPCHLQLPPVPAKPCARWVAAASPYPQLQLLMPSAWALPLVVPHVPAKQHTSSC